MYSTLLLQLSRTCLQLTREGACDACVRARERVYHELLLDGVDGVEGNGSGKSLCDAHMLPATSVRLSNLEKQLTTLNKPKNPSCRWLFLPVLRTQPSFASFGCVSVDAMVAGIFGFIQRDAD